MLSLEHWQIIEQMVTDFQSRQAFAETLQPWGNGPDPLDLVVTIGEAMELWGRSRSTIEMAVNLDQLHARQSGRTWLIAKTSLSARWGYPGASRTLAA